MKKIEFKAKGEDLFVLFLKNMLLTVITLGIYQFWAKVNVTRFLYQSTFFENDSFDFHGTGKEKFFGFLKGLVLISIIIGIFYLINLGLTKLMGESGIIVLVIIVYILILLISPILVIGKEKYRLSRSSYRNLRFGFGGHVKPFLIFNIKGFLLCVVTLGIYIPWFVFDYKKFLINSTRYGSTYFILENANRNEYAKMRLIGFLLTVLTFGVYSFWLNAKTEKYIWDHTTLQGKKLQCSLKGDDLFLNYIICMLIIMFTFGIGIAWAIVRTHNTILTSIGLEEDIDFTVIQAEFDTKASALADGFNEAADFLDTLSDLIG